MRFSDLLQMPFNPESDTVDLRAILSALPDTPEEVARQVYSDHGRKEDFQSAYGRLEISAIEWKQVERPAAEICSASALPSFRQWFVNVGHRVERFEAEGWACIDVRRPVVSHWAEHATWVVPPVLILGDLMGSTGLHLIEGHTRVGILAGLVRRRILSKNSGHVVWLGAMPSANQSAL